MREFESWPRLLGALQRLAWCRAVLRHELCCGVISAGPAAQQGHEMHAHSLGQQQEQLVLSLDIAEMVIEMLGPAAGCGKAMATRGGRIGRAADNSVLCKDAQERVQELWAQRGLQLSAQVEAELFSTGNGEGNDVIAKCVMCHIQTSRWCAGCESTGGHSNLITGLNLPSIGNDFGDQEDDDDEEAAKLVPRQPLRYCEGSVFTSKPDEAPAVVEENHRPWWTISAR